MKYAKFTKEGFEKLKQQKEQLLADRKLAVIDLAKAREMGDLSENGYYKAARLKLSFIDRQLRELSGIIRYGTIVQAISADVVAIGCTIVVFDGKTRQTYKIVGGYESDPLLGKLSHISPIGKALMGKKTGESITVTVPRGVQTYTILSISLV